MKRDKKRGVMTSTLIGWLIAVAVLVLFIILAVLLKDKLIGLLGYIKNLFTR